MGTSQQGGSGAFRGTGYSGSIGKRDSDRFSYAAKAGKRRAVANQRSGKRGYGTKAKGQGV